MKIITLTNQKGGIGKTFTAVVLSQLCTLHGSRDAVVDMDNQQNSVELLRNIDGTPLFTNITPVASPVKMPDLAALAAAGHDLAIIDTPPQVSMFAAVLAMFKHTDCFVIPFMLQRHALFGIENMIDLLPHGVPVLPVCHVASSITKDREKLLAIARAQLGQNNGSIRAAVELPIYSRVEFNLSERRDFYYRLSEKEFARFEALYTGIENALADHVR